MKEEEHSMNGPFFTCFGSISKLEYRSKVGIDIVIEDFDRLDDVAPVLIHASGALANYIRDIECTDAEERYIQSIWTYNSILQLCGIEIPSSDPNIPAKIIVNTEYPPSGSRRTSGDQPIIFGPADYIEDPHPEPMSREEQRMYFQWRKETFYPNHFQWRKDTFYPNPPAKVSVPTQEQNGDATR